MGVIVAAAALATGPSPLRAQSKASNAQVQASSSMAQEQADTGISGPPFRARDVPENDELTIGDLQHENLRSSRRVYRLKLPQGYGARSKESIQIDARSGTIDPTLEVYLEGEALPFKQDDDGGDGTDARVVLPPADYRRPIVVVVGESEGVRGKFDIVATTFVAEKVASLSIGKSEPGVLGMDESRGAAPSARYELVGTGNRLQIDVESPEFDPQLQLRRGTALVARDDDSGPGNSPRLIQRLALGAPYEVVVLSPAGRLGAFKITVTQLSEPGDGVPQVSLLDVDQAVTGRFDALTPVIDGRPYALYRLSSAEKKSFTVVLKGVEPSELGGRPRMTLESGAATPAGFAVLARDSSVTSMKGCAGACPHRLRPTRRRAAAREQFDRQLARRLLVDRHASTGGRPEMSGWRMLACGPLGAGVLALGVAVGALAPAAACSKESEKPELASGPGGLRLFPSGPKNPKTDRVAFDQIASPSAQGQVLGSLEGFDPSRLPATFKAKLGPTGGVVCTATLVGPQVLLTAAHCLDKQQKKPDGSWETVPGGIRLAGETAVRPFRVCEMAPAYVASDPPVDNTPRNAHDFALCELGSAVSQVRAETLAPADSALASTGKSILLAGYGCTEADLTNGFIPRRPGSSAMLRVGQNKVSGDKEGWITLNGRVYTQEAIVCPGDSGGAAYGGVESLAPGPDNGWLVVAVNSAVGPSDAQYARWSAQPPVVTRNAEYVSYLSSLADPEFRTFLTKFVKANKDVRLICGYNLTARQGNCRR
jgi:hypothetical protein